MPYNYLNPATAAPPPAVVLGSPADDGMSLAEIRAELVEQLANRGDILSPRLDAFINEAVKQIVESQQLPDFEGQYEFSTVVDQALYQLPSQVRAVLGVSATDVYYASGGVPLLSMDKNRYRMSAVRSGRPTQYYREGRMLVLWPTPDSSYTLAVDVLFSPVKLVADNQYPSLPSTWHWGIVLKAKEVALKAVRAYTDAAIARNEYTQWVNEKIDISALERSKMHASVFPARRRSDLTGR